MQQIRCSAGWLVTAVRGDEANAKGRTVVSMKDDWTKIVAFQ
jgi:hypothetical protein